MAKYSDRQIRIMAQQVISSQWSNKDKYRAFVFRLALRSGEPPNIIEHKIRQFAGVQQR